MICITTPSIPTEKAIFTRLHPTSDSAPFPFVTKSLHALHSLSSSWLRIYRYYGTYDKTLQELLLNFMYPKPRHYPWNVKNLRRLNYSQKMVEVEKELVECGMSALIARSRELDAGSEYLSRKYPATRFYISRDGLFFGWVRNNYRRFRSFCGTPQGKKFDGEWNSWKANKIKTWAKKFQKETISERVILSWIKWRLRDALQRCLLFCLGCQHSQSLSVLVNPSALKGAGLFVPKDLECVGTNQQSPNLLQSGPRTK